MRHPGWDHLAGQGDGAGPPEPVGPTGLREAVAGSWDSSGAYRVSPLAPAGHDLTWELAVELFEQAGGESVRVIEALAAVLVNRLAGGIGRAPYSAVACPGPARARTTAAVRGAVARPPAAEVTGSGEADRRFEICRRIARRGLGGTLSDPTDGATAFHRHGEHPAWAEDLLPVADAGPFLFYRL